MATMARVEAVALPPAEPPASAQTNGESGSGAFQYLAPGPIMHAAELRQPAEGRGGAPGDASSSSSEESACRSEAAAGREGRPRRRLSAPSSTLDDFMARRRQTVAGATPCFKSEPPGKLGCRPPPGKLGCRPPPRPGPPSYACEAARLLRLPSTRLAALGAWVLPGERSGRRPPNRSLDRTATRVATFRAPVDRWV